MAKDELTQAEIDRIDFIDNTIYAMVEELIPDNTPQEKLDRMHCDMDLVGEISDLIEDFFVRNGVCSDKEFKPYLEG